jgi:VWFA-related protein
LLTKRNLILVAGLLLTAHWAPLTISGQTPLEPDESIRIETDLVDLNVTILSRDRTHPPGSLTQKDFAVFENGAPQEIAFFASAERPFDLVLLLDLSGTTSNKLDLIKKSAQRFVDAAPASDRIAIVTFTSQIRVAAQLTSDRQVLRQAITQMEKPDGGTNFWDALRYVLEYVLPRRNIRRPLSRSAVVVMTDGIDNALPQVLGEGSQTTFAQLVQVLRSSETVVLPVYLDTEEAEVKNHRVPASAYVLAREQLAVLADESGNIVYHARKLKDLDTVYEQVIRDLGTVYSLGYRPINRDRDGAWRTVSVQVPARPDLAVRSRRGYFAK